MLMNIAEDLKEYGKIKVSPMEETPQQAQALGKQAAPEKKPSPSEDLKKKADSSRQRKGEIHNVDDDDEEMGIEAMANYVYMELQSTVAFKEIDIDQMLQHTTLDDFLRGLYVKAVDGGSNSAGKPMSHHDKLLNQLMNTRDERDEDETATKKGPALEFDDIGSSGLQDKSIEMFRGENLKQAALQNLRDRRQRQKQSEIFNQQEALKKGEEESEETASGALSGLERIDLTKTQMASAQEGGDSHQLDEFDLLEAKIDPKDLRTLSKVNKLQDEIEYEKTKIKCKFVFKYAFQTNDPLKIAE